MPVLPQATGAKHRKGGLSVNHKIVLFTLGRVVLIEAALLVLPMAVSLLYGERCALSFALTIDNPVFIRRNGYKRD